MSIKAILLGAGIRGAEVYAKHALQYPEELEFVAVAEPDVEKREAFAGLHHIDAGKRMKIGGKCSNGRGLPMRC